MSTKLSMKDNLFMGLEPSSKVALCKALGQERGPRATHKYLRREKNPKTGKWDYIYKVVATGKEVKSEESPAYWAAGVPEHFKKTLKQTYRFGQPRTDKERAVIHFNKPIEEVTEEDIKKLPSLGTGRDSKKQTPNQIWEKMSKEERKKALKETGSWEETADIDKLSDIGGSEQETVTDWIKINKLGYKYR